MRNILLPLAAATTALVVAAPASAQAWGNLSPAYGAPAYGAPYGNAYGYNRFGQVRSLQVRIDAIQRQIVMLDRRNVLSNREGRRLLQESRQVERQLRRAARYGLNPYEARNMQVRIARLEQHVQREAWDRNGRWGNRGYGYNDRDHRYEREHERWHDRHED